MTNNARVTHIHRGFTLKHSQVVKAVENCNAAWVIFGESFRDLTPAESIAARNQQASQREPLPLAELHGCICEPPANKPRNYELISQANRFCFESGRIIGGDNRAIMSEIAADMRQFVNASR